MSAPHHSLNSNIQGMTQSATVAINDRSNQLIAEGRTIFKLGLGQSPFPVPRTVVAALQRNAFQKDYLPVAGLHALRDAVSRYHQRRDGTTGAAEHVLIGPGSKELMFLLQLVYEGDLVIPAPAWVSYAPQARIIGRRVSWLPTSAANGWRIDPDDLEALCRSDPGRPRILLLNYPSNPTGLTLGDDHQRALADVARRYQVLLLSDEIYGELHHHGQHQSIARHYPEGTIISSGLSKWCGAGGWRLGTFLFPPKLAWLHRAMAVAASETFTSTSAPIQHAAVTAFEHGPEIEDYLDRSRGVLRGLGAWVAQTLKDADVVTHAPEGGFYLLPDFEAHRDRLAAKGIQGSVDLCARLLEETGVAILPGTDFGLAPDALIARMAYVDFDGAAALEAAPDQFQVSCAPVVRAISQLVDWLC